MRIKIGARQSDLARLQAYLVGKALTSRFSNLEIEYAFKASLGDINLTDPLWKMPERGVFTEDFLADLRSGAVDIVVHSWKDMPVEDRSDTLIAATLPRADLRDIVFVRKDRLGKIQDTLKIYSSSPRRSYNLKNFLKEYLPLPVENVEFVPVRGNVPTRFKKFMADDIDGFVMAKAAIDRLLSAEPEEFRETREFLKEQISKCLWSVLPLRENPPAAAQGALAVEVLSARTDLLPLMAAINHKETFECVQEERRILKSYGGGCHQKIGVAIIQKTFGRLTSIRGETDQGEVLNSWKLSKDIAWKFGSDEVWPKPEDDKNFFSRVPRNVSENAVKGKSLWVAKSEALPEAWQLSPKTLVWAAGLETWKKLAKRGVWVCGSSEGLGESDTMGVEALAPQAQWVKLSHGGAGEVSRIPLVATYDLVPIESEINLRGKKCFFWTSGSAFEEALKRYPEIRNAHHACGPGNTYLSLRKVIGEKARFHIFLDYEDWKNSVL
jgi:hydroxymethylbilane synthase